MTPVRLRDGEAVHWDLEVDVVVAGFGFAGAVSAIASTDQGLRSIILEKMPFPGGISITSGGGLAVARDEEMCFRYLKRTCLNTTPDPVLRAVARGLVALPEYIRYLETRSAERVEDMRAVVDPGAHATYDFEGAESIKSMKIAHNPDFKAFPWARGLRGGARLFKLVYDNVTAREIPVHYNTPVRELIQAPDGEVLGVLAETRPEGGATNQLRILARRGVVLATGGFEFAEDMKLQYFWGQPVFGVTALGNTGDGIRMAQSAGANLWHMWHLHGGYGFKFPDFPFAFRHWVGGPRVPTRVMPWILLDKYGRRYMNEYPPAIQDTAVRDMLLYDADRTEYPRIPSVLLFDEEGRKAGPLAIPIFQGEEYSYDWSDDNLKEVERGWIHQADTLEELARQTGIAAAVLQAGLDRWNAACRAGDDTDFGRLPGTMMPISTPPYFWIEAWPIVSNTQGGPVHDEHQRIVDAYGQPIPRLYATGENGSIFGHLYLEAGNVAECFVGGRHAAQHLATLPSVTLPE